MNRKSLCMVFLGLLQASFALNGQPLKQLDFEQLDFSATATSDSIAWLDERNQPVTATHVSSQSHSGSHALLLASQGEKRNFIQSIETSFVGETLNLSGYIRTQDISQLAGLMIQQFDFRGNAIGFEFLKGLTGSTDWQQYQISTALNENTSSIRIGGFVVGAGQAWFDDLSVTVDGQDIALAKPYKPTLLAADTDTEFHSSSQINFDNVSQLQIDNLSKLAQVWGLVKYYHNAVAAGEYNMDAELFRVMPAVLSATNADQANQHMSDWLAKMTMVEACQPSCVKRDTNVALQIDLSWINDSARFGTKLSQQLQHIVANRRFESHYYFGFNSSMGVAVNNELSYGQAHQDTGYRLLALFRVWNLVNYFAPYKSLTTSPWQQVPQKFIGQFVAAKDKKQYEQALSELLSQLDDGHAYLMGDRGNQLVDLFGEQLAPVKLQYLEGQWVVSANLQPNTNELQVGDVITHIDGKSVKAVEQELWPLLAASNDVSRYYALQSRLLQTDKPQLTLTLASKKAVTVATVPIAEVYLQVLQPIALAEHHVIDGKVGYINMTTLKPEDVAPLMQQYQQLPQLIIDLRGYPLGSVWTLAEHLFAKPKVIAKAQYTNINTPGDFMLQDVEVGIDNPNPYRGRIVLLANEESVSQSEFSLMVLRQAPNALVMGSQTAGSDGDVSQFSIPGGYQSQFSGIGILTPNEQQTQRLGIVVDVEVTANIAALRAGEDVVLAQALLLLNSAKFSELIAAKSTRL